MMVMAVPVTSPPNACPADAPSSLGPGRKSI
jgi:hypothetical protein